MKMSIKSQDSVKASLCDDKSRPDSEYSFSSSYHKVTKKTLEMYNPAKISSERPPPEDRHVQYTLSVIDIAMHYIYLRLISVLIYYTLKKNQKTFDIFSAFTEFHCFFSAIFFLFFFFEKQT